MLVGVPREIKTKEFRVGLTPTSVRELVHSGHQVLVETNAGNGAGFSDEIYSAAGASIAGSPAEVFEASEMIVKVKEPQPQECRMLRENQILFTFLHLAPDLAQTQGLIDCGCVAIAYETVTDRHGRLPLLTPMSEVAGRMSIQVGAHCLEKEQQGKGILLGGVPGLNPAKVVILGGGVSGMNAARTAVGMGADVTVIDKSLERLNELDTSFDSRFNTVYSTVDAIEAHCNEADLIIGCVLVPGASAPKLVTREMISEMAPGTVLVDVAVDQGGCFETSKATTHDKPTYLVDDVVHYCVANMPGAVARTSTQALNNATLPFTLALANKGWQRALAENEHLMQGLNVAGGRITYAAIADAHGMNSIRPQEAIGI